MWIPSPKRLLVLSLFFFSILFSNNIYSQFQRANYKILGIDVEGNDSADKQTIIANTGLQVNDEIEYPGNATNDAINRLWALGIFKDVELIIDKKINNGIFLLIKVSEFSRLEKITFSGNDELDEDDFNEVVFFTRGQTLKNSTIFNGKREIKKLYDAEGYLNAEINPIEYSFWEADTTDDEVVVTWRSKADLSKEITTTYDYNPEVSSSIIDRITKRVILVYEIEEGDEVNVRKIQFSGNNNFENGDLVSEFEETEEPHWWKFWSSNNFNQKLFEEDKSLLRQFYLKNGFRDFEILNDSLEYSDDKSEVDIFIKISEGPQYKVRNIEWIGNTIYPDEILNERLGFSNGDIFDYAKFEQNLRGNEKQNDVAALYLDNGYLTFNAVPTENKVAEDSIDISIQVQENNRFKVGDVEIKGNTKTMDKVIRRELYSVPGDYFSRSLVFRSMQQLANLQFFNVEKLYQTGFDSRPVNDSTVNLIYTVEEKSSDYLNASVGYSGSFGFSGALGVTLTNFSIAHPFQMGGGQILNFNWQFGVGNFYRTFSFGFTEPWFLDTPTLVGFDVFDTRQRYVYDLRQSGISFKVGRRLKWPDDFFYIQGLFKYQYNDVIDGRIYYPEGKYNQFTIGATLTRTDIDNPIFPSRGSKISLNAELSGGPLLPGEVDYYKIDFNSEWYKPLFSSNRLALYTSATLGYLNEIVDGTTISPFEYYFMGGSGLVIATTPLRGYEDRSIGPKNTIGDIVGGRVSVKYTTELRAALALDPIPIYILAFAEAGNVYLDLNKANFLDLKRSAGVGARLLINPVGLIGFDLGYGFDKRSVDGGDSEWLFHFQFGRGF
ncbi:MAG: outer membrane protein assembly factor BamA [Melioribacteraceae bacterium]|nr:outer membrane protein assembly factor BamA [Melioribacteraceae bacterium]MCF8264057.1 outer membrane protein assembly factor BamA [Melioribacteraceae bacterium]MCF8411869.1 outer membrane protein assembly factor BamA [Melioribacteraceae bacterium]